MGLFNRDKEQKKQEVTESVEDKEEDEEEFDEAMCPHCGEWIKSVVVKSLENPDRDDPVEIIACPKCNKVLGALEY